ncbi:MAG: GH3 auxin-responsive promoter family protein [Chloroflexota bacterium]|nr:GH3 auxin-responsive promoter family protein [Chloroflexota bacterium]
MATNSLKGFLQPWYDGLENPTAAQQAVLEQLLASYARTDYGREHDAEVIGSVEDYRRAFPVVTYADLEPLVRRAMAGEPNLLLPEVPVGWGMTRGTTGQSKSVPITPTDLEMRAAGSRVLLNYVLRNDHFDILQGACLNLNYPALVDTVQAGGREVPRGYSSGIYARYNAARSNLRIVPAQEEIDALGGHDDQADWQHRFTLVHEQARQEPVTMCIGVTQTMLRFARFLRRRYSLYPKDVWRMQILVCTSIADIHSKYRPALRALYGPVEVLEIYGATEGIFAQQLDKRPYVVPNYDLFFFEVDTSREIKMLHEMRHGETGNLVVSTPVFPRYRIGDLVRCFGAPYYRCIGRERPLARLRYALERLVYWG